MNKYAFKQVDVFTRCPYKGAPVAVLLNAEGLSTAQMQQIANWTNLSETTFVLAPTDHGADYRVRIFTPQAEMPFAGHLTIGTAYALLVAGIIHPHDGRVVQQCGAGLVQLHIAEDSEGDCRIAFELPVPGITIVDAVQQQHIEKILGTSIKPSETPMLVDVGPRWLVVQLANAQAVLSLQPDLVEMAHRDRSSGDTGIVVFGAYPPGSASQIEVRAFAPAVGVNEDPVCGSGNGCVAVYLRETGQYSSIGKDYLATQGQGMRREGRICVSIAPNSIQVGGNAITCINGELTI